MRSIIARLLATAPELTLLTCLSLWLSARGVSAATPSVVPSPNLDLSQLGRVALAGDFDTISQYQYVGQNEIGLTPNGYQSLLTTYPDGSIRTLSTADASIQAMCPFIANGALMGVLIGGNFTTLGGVQAQGVALYNPNTTEITALPGLTGQVSAIYCDAEASMVYVGGSFTGANSMNALAWTTGWTNLPFAGFNGPISSIVKNSAGNIVFGGQFDALGNTTLSRGPNEQVINLASADIVAVGTTNTAGFNDPRNIICKTGDTDGSGNTWLLADRTGGYWQGSFAFGFIPTRLRLYNTRYQGRGTKTFYFEELNSGGVLNLNYTDAQGRNQSCAARCPLPQNNATYQDFYFAPSVGMNMFRIYVVEWYGEGGGLSGIEMFQDDIYSFAVNDFNEPKCDGVSVASNSTVNPANGLWVRTPNKGQTNSDFLTANIADRANLGSGTNVVFRPNLKQSGNYSVNIYTPGCIQDNSCATRGIVTVTVTVTSRGEPITRTIYQTNEYDKFDQIFYGYVDAGGDSFTPSVTLTPQPGQSVPRTVVAQRVGFDLVTPVGGLNGLYEYNPRRTVADSDMSSSPINKAGDSLNAPAAIEDLLSYNGAIYAAGDFTGRGISNVLTISGNTTEVLAGGLNSAVLAIYPRDALVYFGGNFTNAADNSINGLSYVAAYDTNARRWLALGGGVNGPVHSIIPISLNITNGNREECLTINGDFTSINSFGNNPTFDADGLAVWVPSRNNWLNNLPNATVSVRGQLRSFSTVPGFPDLYAGQLSVQRLQLSNVVELVGSGNPSIESLGVTFSTSGSDSNTSTSLRKRYLNPSGNYTGIYAGTFYNQNDLNITVLGGNFEARGNNGSVVRNLVFINNTQSAQTVVGVSGLNPDSAFLSFGTTGTTLFAGGSVTGRVNGGDVNGLVVYDLKSANFVATQPPALTGPRVVVNAIAPQPDSSKIFVGGNFTGAGSLPCSTLCQYDTSVQQWNNVGSGLGGVISSMTWSSNSRLILAGNLTLGTNQTRMAVFDAKKQTFESFDGGANLPGPVSAFSVASSDYNQFWVTGIATANGTTYLSKYADNAWIGVGGFGPGTEIRGLQVLKLTSDHGGTSLMPKDETLLLSGNINILGFGNTSACLFNGSALQPFLLSNRADGTPGFVSNLFVSNPQNFMNARGGHLALGLIVLIGLAIALGLIFLLVVAGILMERNRRRREGYIPMSMDRKGNLERIPPESLLGGIGSKGSPPRI